MSVAIHFSPELATWLVDHLDRGRPSREIVDTMIQERMEPAVAHAILEAFVTARGAGRPLPVDSVIVEEGALEYVYEAPILKPGTRWATSDRVVRVVARMDRPVLAVLADLMSAEECEELIELARPRLRPSTVVDPSTGNDVIAEHRSSFGMFFRLAETPLVARLDQRISEVMNLPLENGEGFQVLHYPEGALNAPHYDFLRPTNEANRASLARSGQRVSTLVTYLNDVEGGGETIFPTTGFAVHPERGNGIYLEYANRLGQIDHGSLHGSNPVTRGEKWVATKWMRQRRFVSAGERASEGMMGY